MTASLSDLTNRDLTRMGTVLVVEDPLVSGLVRAVLMRQGYDVRLAGHAQAAALLASADADIRVLITNSPEVFLEFSESVPLVYLTSKPDTVLEVAFRSCRVVVKPFVPEELVQAVSALAASGD